MAIWWHVCMWCVWLLAHVFRLKFTQIRIKSILNRNVIPFVLYWNLCLESVARRHHRLTHTLNQFSELNFKFSIWNKLYPFKKLLWDSCIPIHTVLTSPWKIVLTSSCVESWCGLKFINLWILTLIPHEVKREKQERKGEK